MVANNMDRFVSNYIPIPQDLHLKSAQADALRMSLEVELRREQIIQISLNSFHFMWIVLANITVNLSASALLYSVITGATVGRVWVVGNIAATTILVTAVIACATGQHKPDH